MAMVHERLYRSDSFSAIDFAAYLRELASHLVETYKVNGQAIEIQFDLQPVSLPLGDAVQFGLIVNELISNAVKHAFPKGKSGTLRIDAAASAGRMILEISDDGVGIPAGMTLEQGGFGLKTVAGIVNHLGGFIKIDRGGGTTFRLDLPLSRANYREGIRP